MVGEMASRFVGLLQKFHSFRQNVDAKKVDTIDPYIARYAQLIQCSHYSGNQGVSEEGADILHIQKI